MKYDVSTLGESAPDAEPNILKDLTGCAINELLSAGRSSITLSYIVPSTISFADKLLPLVKTVERALLVVNAVDGIADVTIYVALVALFSILLVKSGDFTPSRYS